MTKLPLLDKLIEELKQVREFEPEWVIAFAKYEHKIDWHVTTKDWYGTKPAHWFDLDFSEHRDRYMLEMVDVFMCETLEMGEPGQWTDLSVRGGNYELATAYRAKPVKKPKDWQIGDPLLKPKKVEWKPPKDDNIIPKQYHFVIAWTGKYYDYWLHFLGLGKDKGPTPYLMDATLFMYLEWKDGKTSQVDFTEP